MKWNKLLWGAAAGLALSLGAAQPAQADHRRDAEKCFRKVQKEEDKLDRDIRKHGWRSRQAHNRREKIARLRQECGARYGWGRDGWRDDDRRWDRGRYDGRGSSWRRDRDFDRRRAWGGWDHDPIGCRRHNHRHGAFLWFSGRWTFRR